MILVEEPIVDLVSLGNGELLMCSQSDELPEDTFVFQKLDSNANTLWEVAINNLYDISRIQLIDSRILVLARRPIYEGVSPGVILEIEKESGLVIENMTFPDSSIYLEDCVGLPDSSILVFNSSNTIYKLESDFSITPFATLPQIVTGAAGASRMGDGNLEICGVSTEFMAKVWMTNTGEVLGVDEYGICLGSDYVQTSVSTAVWTIAPWDLRNPFASGNILFWRDIETYPGSNILCLGIDENYSYTVNEMGQLLVAINQSQNEINIRCYEHTGALAWESTIEVPLGNFSEWALTSIVQLSDGYVLAGYYYLFGEDNVWSLILLDDEGSLIEDVTPGLNFELSVFPNPVITSGSIFCTVSLPGELTVCIFDIQGRMVASFPATNETGTLCFSIESLPTGAYTVTADFTSFQGIQTTRSTKFIRL